MKQKIENFIEKSIQNKKERDQKISLDDSLYCYSKLDKQEIYGDDYKPKRKLTLHGYKDFCSNCSKQLIVKFLGQDVDDDIIHSCVKYWIETCSCGYEYVIREATYKTTTALGTSTEKKSNR